MDLRDYIYDNGVTKRYHICRECGSKAMRMDPVGGFQAPDWLCMECGSIEHAPTWEEIAEPAVPEDKASEAWLTADDRFSLALKHALNVN